MKCDQIESVILNAYRYVGPYMLQRFIRIGKMETLRLLSEYGKCGWKVSILIYQKKKLQAIVDYAHTTGCLGKNVLDTISTLRTGNENVNHRRGCGGTRDKSKRPVMGFSIASSFKQVRYFSLCNPRSESRRVIISRKWKLGRTTKCK